MLGWVSKNGAVPPELVGFPIGKGNNAALGTVYRFKGLKTPNPTNPDLIKLDDNFSVFKITEDIDPLMYAKPQQIGKEIKLDETMWKVPVLRYFPDGSELPQKLVLTSDGEKYIPKKEHFKAWTLGDTILNEWLTGKTVPSNDELRNAMATILQINYWITVTDIKVYGLLTTDTITDFLEYVVNLKAIMEAFSGDDLKKKELTTD